VDPVEDGRKAHVIITTDIDTRGGLLGPLERFLVTRLLQPAYQREIEQLGTVASERARNEG
jgi:hypothetical protein